MANRIKELIGEEDEGEKIVAKPTKFYNLNPKNTIIHNVLPKIIPQGLKSLVAKEL